MSIPNHHLLYSYDTFGITVPRYRSAFEKLGGSSTVFGLLGVLPTNLLKRRYVEAPALELVDGLITFRFRVLAHRPNLRKSQPYGIFGEFSESGVPIELIFFNPYSSFLKRIAPENAVIAVSGKLALKKQNEYKKNLNDLFCMSHPDHMGPLPSLNQWEGVERVYPLSAGLSQKSLRTTIDKILGTLRPVPEWIAPDIVQRFNFPNWNDAFQNIHAPKTVLDLSPLTPFRQRLAYDELFAKQLAHYFFNPMPMLQKSEAAKPADSVLLAQFLANLPFSLTVEQKTVVNELIFDMTQKVPMHRLLQGDVGSGKTVVALAAAIFAIEQGKQVAFLVPTDILARQHIATIETLFKGLSLNGAPLNSAILTGREKGKTRANLLHSLSENKIHIVVGTHALFQADVIYADLGFVILDEQHRFGVKQRLDLTQKSQHVDVLSMSATPIPRTLLLANFGDMAVSKLKDKPPNRKPITTYTVSLGRMEEILSFVGERIQNGEKIFWICPLVEESQTLDLTAATNRFEQLEKAFPNQVVLTHGKQKSAEKEEAITRFAASDAKLLVATTVIEVGVDIPDATVMIIEHAERFGLAQLHQLRGRIGRGQLAGTCFLLFADNLTYVAKQRLKMMKKTNDGFELAEADLRLRGGGDPLGLRQSGLPQFKFACLASEDEEVNTQHQLLFEIADEDAKTLIRSDPELKTERGQAAFVLLSYFELQDADLLKKAG